MGNVDIKDEPQSWKLIVHSDNGNGKLEIRMIWSF